MARINGSQNPRFDAVINVDGNSCPRTMMRIIIPRFIRTCNTVRIRGGSAGNGNLTNTCFITASARSDDLRCLVKPAGSGNCTVDGRHMGFNACGMGRAIFPAGCHSCKRAR